MSTTTHRALTVTGIVASLLIATASASAHDRHNGYALRYVPAYRPAVVVVPPGIVGYSYPVAPAYYPPPAYAPAYYAPAPAYYAPLVYYRPSRSIVTYGTWRGHGHY
jgi:hypothetical protein